ncbi:helix-turn-helix domain-containing protein [Deinococcus arcticus]|nr:helix-turn-helix domain-containing protein [Deinococcus arcticus]
MRDFEDGRTYSRWLRGTVVEDVQKGMPIHQVAQYWGVHRNTVRRYVQQDAAGTLYFVGQPTGRPRKLAPELELQVLAQFDADPVASLREHARRLTEETGVEISYRTIGRILKRHEMTYQRGRGWTRPAPDQTSTPEK